MDVVGHYKSNCITLIVDGATRNTASSIFRNNSQDTQPPLTPRQGLDYRGRVPDASP